MLIEDRIDLERALNSAGLLVEDLQPGELVRCKATGDKGTQRSGWYRLFDDGDLVTCVFGDWRQDSKGIWVSGNQPQTSEQRAIAQRFIEQAKRERREAQLLQWAGNRAKLTSLWNSAAPIKADDSVGLYLANRGLSVPDAGALRYHKALSYWDDGKCIGQFSAMLGVVTSPSGELVSVHRTFLTEDGHKAPVPIVKKLSSSAGAMAGASIKIGAPVSRPGGGQVLGVAEGIETAIAASILGGIPVWSCVSAHGLASFEPPADVTHVYIFADNDENEVGQKAASRLGERLARQGLSVRIHTPPTVGDWADELIMRGAVA